MAQVVDDLVVRLGFQTRGAKAAMEAVQRIQAGVSRVQTRGGGVANALGSFFSGIGSSFKQGWAEGLQQGAVDKALKRTGKSAAAAKKPVKELKQALKQAGDSAAAAKKPVMGLQEAFKSLLALGAVVWARNQAHELMDLGSQLNKVSNELGISTDAVQELRYAAVDADIGIEDLVTGMRALAKQSQAAQKGSKESAAAFAGLGINIKELSELSADEQFMQIAESISHMEDPLERNAVAMRVFGRSGANLLPLLTQGAAGIEELRAEFRELGGGLTGDAIESLGDMEKELKRADAAFLGLKSSLVLLFVPAVVWVQRVVASAVKWFTELDRKAHVLQAGGIAALIFGFGKLAQIMLAMGKKGFLSSLLALAPWIGLGLAIAAIAILIQDLWNGLTGGRSAIFEWLAAWAGLEKVDSWIRDIKAGLEYINNVGVTGAVGDALKGFSDARKNRLDQAGAQGRLDATSGLVEAYEKMPSSPTRDAALAVAKRRQADAQSDMFGLRGTDMRTVGRGLAAPLAHEVDAAYVKGTPEYAARLENVDASTTVNVNVETGADPAKIGSAVKEATKDAQNSAARKIAAAAGKR